MTESIGPQPVNHEDSHPRRRVRATMTDLITRNPFTDPFCRHDNQRSRICECGVPLIPVHVAGLDYPLDFIVGEELPDRSRVLAYGEQGCVIDELDVEFERLAMLTLLPQHLRGYGTASAANYQTFFLWPDGTREAVQSHLNIVGAVQAYVDTLGMEWP